MSSVMCSACAMIMNYLDDLAKMIVQEQDIVNLIDFYAFEKAVFNDFDVFIVRPEDF
ncbi:hypothetical protein B0H67DRAFT_645672 [Lasiosphaeris hirsuta]|uniref:Uncharacterized protein n=1 Tax=Lasiosphaeris hirsuta TaxID=260670 RepID=A0AA40AHP2_9PEZI|nr:hypothetical protein B0H67DRAFT_645672 [Lasiosphaeris hirsuta]